MDAPFDVTVSAPDRARVLARGRAARLPPSPDPSPGPDPSRSPGAGLSPEPGRPLKSPRCLELRGGRPRSPTPSPSPRVRTPPFVALAWMGGRPSGLDGLPFPRVLYPGGVVVAPSLGGVVEAPGLGGGSDSAANTANALLIDFEWDAAEHPDWPGRNVHVRPPGLFVSPLSRCPWLWVWLPGGHADGASECLVRKALASAQGALAPWEIELAAAPPA